ncbi:MAG: MFS transporter [Thermoflavifilum sp.]|nr:MFS transporter [Thermoflavifilum sp.]MCL6514546.1 MFS transporter [Alicyclobacillus sp.]
MEQAAKATPSPSARVRRGPLLVTIALGVLLNPLNSSMIAVALSRLEHVFHLSFTTASWLISAYYLASAIAQPVMGKVSDFVGRKKIFLVGLVLVAVSSFTASFAPSFGWLIAFRLIQSFGSGAIYPAGMGIVRNHITERQSQALAVMSVFASGAAAFGPSIGGFLVHYGDWPAIFWVNFPFVIASFLLALWTLPADPPRHARRQTHGGGFRELLRGIDIPGIILFSALIVCGLLFLLSLTGNVQWAAGVLAVVALAGFILLELRSASPFIDLRMFGRNRGLTWVLLQFVTVNIIFYSIFFGMPQFLQEARGFNSQQTGLLMLAVAGFGVVMAPITGRWVARSGVRPPLLLAGICMTTGSILFWTIHERTPVWWLVICLAVLGVSNGFNNVGLQTALFRVTPKQIIGTASGLFQTSRYLGTILSSVLLGLFFGNHLDTPSLHALGTVLAVLGLLVIWMSWRLPGRGASPAENASAGRL